MKLKDVVPLLKHQQPYQRAAINLYKRDYKEEFKVNKLLYEALEKTYPRQDVIAHLKTKFRVYVYADVYDAKNILVRLVSKETPPVKQILQFVAQQGWFISTIETERGDFKGSDPNTVKLLLTSQYEQAILTLEAIHGANLPTPKLLYHATLLQVWETKIKHYGLSPKSKSTKSTHPERVYFTTTIDSAVEAAIENAHEKLKVAKTRDFDLNKFDPEQYYKQWVVLEINTAKIPNIRGLSYFRVHEDPNMEKRGFIIPLYSQNYIPPVAIRVVKRFNAY